VEIQGSSKQADSCVEIDKSRSKIDDVAQPEAINPQKDDNRVLDELKRKEMERLISAIAQDRLG
jgi:hypothetical protein